MNIMSHERIEKSVVILGILTFFAVIWGGLVQIVPLFFDDQMHPKDGYVKPYEPLRLAGFNIYVREGCYGCHSQMIRPTSNLPRRVSAPRSNWANPTPRRTLTAWTKHSKTKPKWTRSLPTCKGSASPSKNIIGNRT